MLDMMKVQEEMKQAGACTSARINGLKIEFLTKTMGWLSVGSLLMRRNAR